MTTELNEILNYRRLSDRIATAGQPSERPLKAIALAGFEVVINLGLTDQDYSLPDEKGLVESLGLLYEHIPVLWENPTRNDFEEFLRVMERYRDRKLFIHCMVNMRVSAFMYLYRVLRENRSREEALEEMHHIWEPNETWSTFIESMMSLYGNMKHEE